MWQRQKNVATVTSQLIIATCIFWYFWRINSMMHAATLALCIFFLSFFLLFIPQLFISTRRYPSFKNEQQKKIQTRIFDILYFDKSPNQINPLHRWIYTSWLCTSSSRIKNISWFQRNYRSNVNFSCISSIHSTKHSKSKSGSKMCSLCRRRVDTTVCQYFRIAL